MQDLKVDSIKNENDTDMFIALKKGARENIFISFRCTPELLGLPRENQGFDTSQVMDEFQLYNRTCIIPLQKKILKVLRNVLCVEDIKILPFQLEENAE